jgi:predicted metal-dependent HD superfamily phosphohydrolase
MKATLEQFTALCQALGAEGDGASTFGRLEVAYGKPPRRYHTLEHIGWGLRRLDEMAEVERRRGAKFDDEAWNLIRWAFWFHDAILCGSPDDEQLSADVAALELEALHAHTNERTDTVRRLIMATAHDRVPLAYDAAIMCDADLSILGASAEDFDRYEALVREEWAHVPEHLFAGARHQILGRIAAHPWIYMTEFGRQRWEVRARENLARSMASLEERAKIPEGGGAKGGG